MKKTIFMMAFFAILFTQSVVAANGVKTKANDAVQASFSKDFILTSNVSWNKINDVFAVSFLQTGTPYVAYYTEEGELKGISNNIQPEMLPEAITKKINKRFKNAEIKNIIKYRSLTDGNAWFIQLKTNRGGKVVKGYSDGSIEVVSKA